MKFIARLRRWARGADESFVRSRQPAPRMYVTRRDDLRAGARISVTAWSMRGQTGTLIRPSRLFNGKPAWVVQMDNPKGLWRGRTRVGDRVITVLTDDE